MEEFVVYSQASQYRDDFRIKGFRFGSGRKALAVVGSMRGNEHQQLYACAQLVKRLNALEQSGRLTKNNEILVIPCANPWSMNIRKRFWSIDNTDINRMFPGYAEGETTQRIAAGIFEAVKDYAMGIQFASFYMRGSFAPHVRIMRTGFEDVERARQFGLPYVIIRNPRPFDTTTLNYNWQIWETSAFSLYTTSTQIVNRESAAEAVEAILRFMTINQLVSLHVPSTNNFPCPGVDNMASPADREVRTTEANTTEVCTMEVNTTEVRTTEVNTTEVRTTEVNTTEVCTTGVHSQGAPDTEPDTEDTELHAFEEFSETIPEEMQNGSTHNTISQSTITQTTENKGESANEETVSDKVSTSNGLSEEISAGAAANVRVISDDDLVTVRTREAGFFHGEVHPGNHVQAGEELARIEDPYDAHIRARITAPVSGNVLFMHDEDMCYADSAVYKLIT